jgi:Reverse transcriptase (RNA-dependent DNA polymerase)
VDHYVRNGSTVSICALDLPKAFDCINHHDLNIKLMKRRIPIELLQVIEHWFSICLTCVKWRGCFSHSLSLDAGTRPGGVLSPVFFNIYIDEVVSVVNNSGIGCHVHHVNAAILVMLMTNYF